MLRIADEVRFWTSEEAEAVLREALAIVTALDPPDDLRVAVFTQAGSLLSQKHANLEAIGLGVPNMTIPAGRR